MHFFFDESGDFAFPSNRFDCYTQAALVCPDSQLQRLSSYVESRCRKWNVDELHASQLPLAKVEAICRHLAGQPLVMSLWAFDTDTISPGKISTWRDGQADKIAHGREWYVTHGVGAQPVIDHMSKLEGWARNKTRCSDGQFIQGMFWIHVLYDALQQTLISYHDDSWRNDFRDFQFILDAKLPGKMDTSEKWLRDTIGPIVQSNPQHYSLGVLDTWADDPVHPFVERYDTGDGISVNELLADGLQCKESHTEAGLQLVDTVAHVVRRAVLEPDNAPIQRAYELLVPQLRNNGAPFHIAALSEPERDADHRYRHLYREIPKLVPNRWRS